MCRTYNSSVDFQLCACSGTVCGYALSKHARNTLRGQEACDLTRMAVASLATCSTMTQLFYSKLHGHDQQGFHTHFARLPYYSRIGDGPADATTNRPAIAGVHTARVGSGSEMQVQIWCGVTCTDRPTVVPPFHREGAQVSFIRRTASQQSIIRSPASTEHTTHTR